MTQLRSDIRAFYDSLPAWAQVEFQVVMDQAERGELDGRQVAAAVQDILNRTEHPRQDGGYIH